MTYKPRPGDTVRITARITNDLAEIENGPIMQFVPSSPRLRQLVEAGEVELVARAEPDWQQGDIGQHIESGNFWVLLYGTGGVLEWRRLDRGPDCWLTPADLAGKLRRCTVTPEDDDAPAPRRSHEHLCSGGAEAQPGGTPQHHRWAHDAAGCNWPEDMGCPECGPAPAEADRAERFGVHA